MFSPVILSPPTKSCVAVDILPGDTWRGACASRDRYVSDEIVGVARVGVHSWFNVNCIVRVALIEPRIDLHGVCRPTATRSGVS